MTEKSWIYLLTNEWCLIHRQSSVDETSPFWKKSIINWLILLVDRRNMYWVMWVELTVYFVTIMPRTPRSTKAKRNYITRVLNVPDDMFRIIEVANVEYLFCSYCDARLRTIKLQAASNHVNGKRHREIVELRQREQIPGFQPLNHASRWVLDRIFSSKIVQEHRYPLTWFLKNCRLLYSSLKTEG